MSKRTCSLEDCDDEHYGHGYCGKHYQKWRKYGDPLAVRKLRSTALCDVDDCDEQVWARGWCHRHYGLWYDHGDPLIQVNRSPNPGGICEIPDCPKPAWARGWCPAHYTRWRKYDDPLGVAPKRPPRPRKPRLVRLCEFPGCDKKHSLHGYCRSHWNQVREDRPLAELQPYGGHRLYSLNHAYFDEITDERRAYWLGFITADGCVLRDDEGRNRLVVSLKASDSGHLQTLCDDLGSDRPVLFSRRNEATAGFNSGQIVEALIRLGVTPRKSLTVRPWDGPPELMQHYWRGLVDGDGCIHKKAERQKWTLSIVGTQACVDRVCYLGVQSVRINCEAVQA